MLSSDRIRATRALLRWSARQLAEKAGVHITTVQRMEGGDGPVGGTVQTLPRSKARWKTRVSSSRRKTAAARVSV